MIHFSLGFETTQPEMQLPTLGSDSLEYSTLAQNLINHHWFSMSTSMPAVPEVFRTIGYPLFVAAFVLLFKSYFIVTLVQIMLTILTGVLIFRMGKSLFSENIGFIAALVFIFEPNTVFHTLIILSDTLFVFLLVSFVYLLFFTQAQTFKKLLIAGIVLGFATLVRPIAVFSLGLFIPVYWWMNFKTYSRKILGLFLLALLLGYAALVSPWLIRNKIQTGYWSLSSVSNVNLYHYNVPDFLAWKGMPRNEAYALVEKETGITLEQARSLDNAAVIKDLTKKYIFADPIHYAEFHVIRGLPFIFSSGLSLVDQFNTGFSEPLYKGHIPRIIINLERLAWVGILGLVLLSVFVFKKEKRVWLFLIIICYFWALTGPVAYARYRLPAEPFLLILACAAIQAFLSKKGILHTS
jgi:4-amino-4-deoxy-L-arabinose transferase-like glycosyltransferase